MLELLRFVLAILAALFKSRRRLEAENAVLWHHLIVLRRKVPRRVRLANGDRWFLVQLYQLFPSILQALTIIRPETLVRWHRAGFRNLSFPKIPSGLDSHRKAESSHPCERLRSSRRWLVADLWDRFNNRRLLEPIGNIPPAEAEERYAMLEEQAMAA